MRIGDRAWRSSASPFNKSVKEGLAQVAQSKVFVDRAVVSESGDARRFGDQLVHGALMLEQRGEFLRNGVFGGGGGRRPLREINDGGGGHAMEQFFGRAVGERLIAA